MLPPPRKTSAETLWRATVLTKLSDQDSAIKELRTDMKLVKERVTSFDIKRNGAVTGALILLAEIVKVAFK